MNKYAKRFYDYVRSEGYSLAEGESYKGSNGKIKLLCSEGHVYKVMPRTFKEGSRCVECRKNIVKNKFIKNVKESKFEIKDINDYKGAIHKVRLSCPKGHDLNMTPSVFNKGHRCKFCAHEKRFKEERSLYKRKFLNAIESEGYEMINKKDYVNSQKSVIIKHKNCGYEYEIRPVTFVSVGSRCLKCFGNMKKTNDYIKGKIENETNFEYSLLSEYKGANKKIKVRHNSRSCDNNIWWVTPASFIIQKTRCEKCFGKYRKGKDNPTYNHKISDEERIKGRFYKIKEKTNWRKAVFSRDSYTCKICQSMGVHLHAHHLDGYNWCKEKRFDVDNGVTMCRDCHYEFHKNFGYGNNTKKQFEKHISNLLIHS